MYGDTAFYLYWIPLVIVALTVHEFSHAWVADLLGDSTPRYAGRLTLNPLPHIDPIGFFMLIVARFGWAKPVPINPNNFQDPKQGTLWVGLAGPISNLALAWVLSLLVRLAPTISPLPFLVNQIIVYAIWLNVALAVFNLIPIPPLDGARILAGLLPPEQAPILETLEQYGFMILILILFFPPTHQLIFATVDFIFNFLI